MRLTHSGRSVLASVGLVGLGMLASPGWRASPHSDSPNLEALAALAPQDLDHLMKFARHMRMVELANQDGETSTTMLFTGVNVQIVNGLNATNGFPSNRSSTNPAETVVNGLGNLIVGYNEGGDNFIRSGSHNIIAGTQHRYSSFGGLVMGSTNTISGVYSSVSGGFNNTASGNFSSVSGGHNNTASGDVSTASGGQSNTASGDFSSASGQSNTASGDVSTVSGGAENTAGGNVSTVSGGARNTASGDVSTVSGGHGVTVLDLFGHAP